MILTNYFIKKKVQELAAGLPERKRGFSTLKEAHRILVLYQAKDQEAVAPGLERLRGMHKQVVACLSVADHTSCQALPADCHTLDVKKDLTIWGIPKEDKCKEIKEIKADIVINLCDPDHYAMQYIMLQHDCSFTAGIKQGGTDLYDLSILVTDRDDIKYLFEQILFYLQSIRSK